MPAVRSCSIHQQADRERNAGERAQTVGDRDVRAREQQRGRGDFEWKRYRRRCRSGLQRDRARKTTGRFRSVAYRGGTSKDTIVGRGVCFAGKGFDDRLCRASSLRIGLPCLWAGYRADQSQPFGGRVGKKFVWVWLFFTDKQTIRFGGSSLSRKFRHLPATCGH